MNTYRFEVVIKSSDTEFWNAIKLPDTGCSWLADTVRSALAEKIPKKDCTVELVQYTNNSLEKLTTI